MAQTNTGMEAPGEKRRGRSFLRWKTYKENAIILEYIINEDSTSFNNGISNTYIMRPEFIKIFHLFVVFVDLNLKRYSPFRRYKTIYVSWREAIFSSTVTLYWFIHCVERFGKNKQGKRDTPLTERRIRLKNRKTSNLYLLAVQIGFVEFIRMNVCMRVCFCQIYDWNSDTEWNKWTLSYFIWNNNMNILPVHK